MIHFSIFENVLYADDTLACCQIVHVRSASTKHTAKGMHNALHCMVAMHLTELHCNDLYVCVCVHISAQLLNSTAVFKANTYVVNAGS